MLSSGSAEEGKYEMTKTYLISEDLLREGPEANGMKFCCFCGKKLVEVRAEREEENE